MTHRLTRRHLLKLIAAATATAALSPVLHARARYPRLPLPPEPMGVNTWELYGRAIYTVAFYKEPNTKSERLATRGRDESFRILEEVQAPFSAHNDRWFRTELGYAHSAWVLPVQLYPPQPFIQDLEEWGFWGEISQIYTEGRTAPDVNAARKYRFYGGTVFHVIEAVEDSAGTGWYKVVDDYPPKQVGNHQWILARDVRRIPRAELAPIHPFVSNKRMEMNLAAQSLTCYEGDTPVFQTLTASGLGGVLATPPGEYCVLLKQASRHMSNVPYEGSPELQTTDIFDLPGVPWNTFFAMDGSAIHGAYWHNDFGVPRSHGCINVPIRAGQWIYRWTHPIGGYEDEYIQSSCKVGTKMVIRAG